MELSFHGAAREVTGSCHMLRATGATVLLDCGLFQGRRQESFQRNLSFGFDPRAVDAVVQSHAHIDHSGRLPLLVRQGFRGAIHATGATLDLCEVMLADSAGIQEKDAEFLNRKFAQQHRPPIAPLYGDGDAARALQAFRAHPYHAWFEAAPGLHFRFYDAGHILGSAWVEARIVEGGRSTTLVFTGDYGRRGTPILRDPEPLVPADLYIAESTYGDRCHPPFPDMENELLGALQRLAQRRRGKLLIPAFAVGRTQLLLYAIGRLFDRGRVPRMEVVVDSPLAAAATHILQRHCEVFDEEARAHVTCSGTEAREFVPGVRFTETPEESKALNRHPGPLVILSASGMMETGRILHHLDQNIHRDDCEVLVPGFQAAGTLGRKLVDGAAAVNILGERHEVRARITPILGFSAHADRDGLLGALAPHAERARTLFLVHGEDGPRQALRGACADAGFARIEEPAPGQSFVL